MSMCEVTAVHLHGLLFNPKRSELLSLQFFTHLKLCLATAIHNPKWVQIT